MTQSIGAYDLEGELGRGAQGIVFRARHRPTGAPRAVKVLAGAGRDESLERFRREAQALALAGHVAVTVHEVGNESGRHWIAMDLCPGGSLADRLAGSGKLPWRDAAALVAEVARGLDRAHELGLVHRDLKPANVLFDEEGRPRICDWGMARDLGRTALTTTGSFPGTPAYAAPERLRGEPADRRADVWSLGVILHELVAGAYPFQGPGWQEMAANIVRAAPEPLARSGAPLGLDQIVRRALAPNPSSRTPTAAKLAAELDALLAGVKSEPPPGRRTAVIVASIVTFVVGAALLVALGRDTPPLPEPPRRASPPRPPAPPPRPVAPRLREDAAAIAKWVGSGGTEGETGIGGRLESFRLDLPDLLRAGPDVARDVLGPVARVAREDAFSLARNDAFAGGVLGAGRRHAYLVSVFSGLGLQEGKDNATAKLDPLLRNLPVEIKAALLVGEPWAAVEGALRDAGPADPVATRGAWIAPLEKLDPVLAAAAWCVTLRLSIDRLRDTDPAVRAGTLDPILMRWKAAGDLSEKGQGEGNRLFGALVRHDVAVGISQFYERLAQLSPTLDLADERRTAAAALLVTALDTFPRSSYQSQVEVRYDRKRREDSILLAYELLALRRDGEVTEEMIKRIGRHPFTAEVQRRRGKPREALELLDPTPEEWLRLSSLCVRALALADMGELSRARQVVEELKQAERVPHATHGLPGYPSSREVEGYIESKERAR